MKRTGTFNLLFLVLVSMIFAYGLFGTSALAAPQSLPVASFTASPTSGVVPLTVLFNASTSTGTTTYDWDFGDGTSGTGVIITHTYINKGTYTAKLTVSNADGNASAQKAITIQDKTFGTPTFNQPSVTVTQQDAAKTVAITVVNKGNIPADISLNIQDLTSSTDTLPAGLLDWPTSSVTVQPSKSYTFNVTIGSLPTTVSAGTYVGPFTLTFDDASGSSLIDSETFQGNLTVVVNEPLTGAKLQFVQTEVSVNNVQRNVQVSVPFKIQNVGGETIYNINIAPNIDSTYSPIVSPTNFTLASGETKSATLKLTLPTNADASTLTFDDAITVTPGTPANAEVLNSLSVKLQPATFLKITDVKYDIQDGQSGSLDTDSSSDTITDDVKPGDTVDLRVTVENMFTTSTDLRNVRVRIQNIDGDLDFDSTSEKVSRLSDGSDKEFSYSFSVDSAASDGDTLSFDISATADDENGASYEQIFRVDVEITQPNNEIKVTKVSFSPSQVTCEKKVRLNVDLENTGTNDQSKVTVEIKNVETDAVDRQLNIALDSGDTTTVRFDIDVSNLKPGTYPFDVTSYYSTNKQSDVGAEDLVVVGCSGTGSNTNTGNQGTGANQGSNTGSTQGNTNTGSGNVPPDVSDFPTTGNVATGKPAASNQPDWLVLALLGIAIIVVIILIIVLLARSGPRAR